MTDIKLRNENGKIVGYDPETGNNIPVSVEDLDVEETSFTTPDGTPAIEFEGFDAESLTANRSTDEVLVSQHPDNPDSNTVRLTFDSRPGKSVYLGRLNEADDGTITSHEALKFPSNRDVALEAEADGKLRLQESVQNAPYTDNITTHGAIQLETSDSTGAKTVRMRFYGGTDSPNVEFKSIDLIDIGEDDTPLNWGANREGFVTYDSGIDHLKLDTDNNGTTKVVLAAQHTNHIQLRGDQTRHQVEVDLNGKTEQGRRNVDNASASDLKEGEVVTDASNGRIVWKDSSGTAYYAAGTAL